jgi:hypothetical protein
MHDPRRVSTGSGMNLLATRSRPAGTTLNVASDSVTRELSRPLRPTAALIRPVNFASG